MRRPLLRPIALGAPHVASMPAAVLLTSLLDLAEQLQSP